MTGKRIRQVRDALCAAYSETALKEMVRACLEIDMDRIVSGSSYEVRVYRLIDRLQQDGQEYALVEAAYQERPHHAQLQQVYIELGLGPQGLPTDPTKLRHFIEHSQSTLKFSQWCDRVLTTQRQVCQVELAGRLAGTGILVGRGMVLTNAQVLDPVQQGKIPPGEVTFRFDYKRIEDRRTMSGELFRLAEQGICDWSPRSDADRDGKPLEDPRTADQLNFVLVKIERNDPGMDDSLSATEAGEDVPEVPSSLRSSSAGSVSGDIAERDWLRLPRRVPVLGVDSPLYILHHLTDGSLRLTVDTKAVLAMSADKIRMNYRTNVNGITAGSPCFNRHWELVALHQGSDPVATPPGYSRGISSTAIRALLKKRGKTQELGTRPVWRWANVALGIVLAVFLTLWGTILFTPLALFWLGAPGLTGLMTWLAKLPIKWEFIAQAGGWLGSAIDSRWTTLVLTTVLELLVVGSFYLGAIQAPPADEELPVRITLGERQRRGKKISNGQVLPCWTVPWPGRQLTVQADGYLPEPYSVWPWSRVRLTKDNLRPAPYLWLFPTYPMAIIIPISKPGKLEIFITSDITGFAQHGTVRDYLGEPILLGSAAGKPRWVQKPPTPARKSSFSIDRMNLHRGGNYSEPQPILLLRPGMEVTVEVYRNNATARMPEYELVATYHEWIHSPETCEGAVRQFTLE
jgi:hypothetical protein